MLGTWDASTVALVPQSVASHLPYGAVAAPISVPAASLETHLMFRSADQGAALKAFVEVASEVFAPVDQISMPRSLLARK